MGTYFVIILLMLVLFSSYTLNLLKGYMFEQNKMDVLTNANIISSYVAENGFDKLSFEMEGIVSQMNISKDTRVFVLDHQARVRYDSNFLSNLSGRVLLEDYALNALSGENDYRKMEIEGDYVAVAAVPIVKDAITKGVVCLRVPATDIMQLLKHFNINLVGLSIVISVIIGLISFLLANIITAPIQKLSQSIKKITKDNIHARLDVSAKGEIGELAETFTNMTDELQSLEEKRQEFVSNASHELKTPLSSIKLICDSLLAAPEADPAMTKEFLQDMNNEVDRLTRIINKLLDLTKMDVQQQADKEQFVTANLKDIVSGVVQALSGLAAKKGIHLSFESQNDVFMLMDEDKIWEAVYNIIDNSIKYTGEGGAIEVYLERETTKAIVTVKDTGIGMAKDEISKIFDRFYRIDKARARDTGGTGLGLSIALSAVQLHDGFIEVQSEEGQGSTFRIYLAIA